MNTLATIGYEGATVQSFLAALRGAEVQLLVDVRAVASSRRPGFSKTRLSENVREVGIDYLHLRALGTPAEGRAAARAGRHAEMHAIFAEHLATPEAQTELGRWRRSSAAAGACACSASRPIPRTATARWWRMRCGRSSPYRSTTCARSRTLTDWTKPVLLS
jgi:hypothetical protein